MDTREKAVKSYSEHQARVRAAKVVNENIYRERDFEARLASARSALALLKRRRAQVMLTLRIVGLMRDFIPLPSSILAALGVMSMMGSLEMQGVIMGVVLGWVLGTLLLTNLKWIGRRVRKHMEELWDEEVEATIISQPSEAEESMETYLLGWFQRDV